MDRADLYEDCLERFESAWRAGRVPRIDEFLPGREVGEEARCRCLRELVKLDLEYRWRRQPGGAKPWLIEDYVSRHRELGPSHLPPVELIVEEYRVRQCWGDRPRHDHYLQRFPGHGETLRTVLSHMDRKIAAELSLSDRTRLLHPGDKSVAAACGASAKNPSAVEILELLRSHQLVEAARLREAKSKRLLDRFPGSQMLARELVRLGWLTPFQMNQVLLGRAADLVVGPYRLLERLGEGGTAQVYRARHRLLNRDVALKLVHRDLRQDEQTVSRFRREIKVVSKLRHPNIVQALDAGLVGDSHFLAMELLKGEDLYRLVKRCGPLPIVRACGYIRQAALGLQHAYEQGIVHRDVKPSNLLLTAAGTVKVLDLGLAGLQRAPGTDGAASDGEHTCDLTPAGAVFMMGTPDYLAPEQALDFHGADTRADIYSLGCTFYYLLTGRPPFSGTLAQKLVKHQQAAPTAVEQLRPDVPAGLSAILAKMIAKRPQERYQTPGEVAAALEPFVRPRGSGRFAGLSRVGHALAGLWKAGRTLAGGALNAGRTLGLVVRRRPTLAAVAAVAVLIVAIVIGVSLRSGGLEPLPGDEARTKVVHRAQELGAAGAVVRLLGTPGEPPLRSLAIRPDGKILAGGRDDGSIHLWHMADGSVQGTLRRGTAAPAIRSLAFSPDGRTLASCDAAGGLRLWDLESGQEQTLPSESRRTPERVAFSSDGKTLFVTGMSVVRRWDMATRMELEPLRGVGGVVTSLAFSPDGRTLAAASHGQPIRRWELATGNEITPLNFLPIHFVAYAPDGQTLAIGPSVRLVDLATGTVRDASEQLGEHVFADFTANGELLLFPLTGGEITLRSPASLKRVVARWQVPGKLASTRLPAPLALTPDRRHLALGDANGTVHILCIDAAPAR